MISSADLAIFSSLRQRMVDLHLRARGIVDKRVLDAMCGSRATNSFRNAIAIRRMKIIRCRLAKARPSPSRTSSCSCWRRWDFTPADKVLEIGTGSGYVTALLAELTAQVISIERHAALADAARDLFASMGYGNVRVITGDGTRGFREAAPYDAIIVSAAAPELPQELVAQLAEGGRMILPVGSIDSQQLQFIEKRNGQPRITLRELCRFVPLVSG